MKRGKNLIAAAVALCLVFALNGCSKDSVVAHHQFNPIQTAATQPLEENDPAGLVLFHTLCGAQNLTVSVLVDRNCCPTVPP